MSKAPLPWFGGKQLLAERLVALLPEHRVYCEPCGGAGSVLFSKPRSHLEVYNDADGDLVAFMRALRDEPAELRRLLEWTPFSREEFLSCASSYRTLAPSLERTRRWYVTVCQSLNACRSATSWSGDRSGAANVPAPVRYAYRIAQLERFARRLQGVQVEHLDWRVCVERYASPQSCLYLDPPYHAETRRSGGYEHDWTADDHAELLALLPELPGAVLVSGYRCPSYDAALAAWDRVDYEVSAPLQRSQRPQGDRERLEERGRDAAASPRRRGGERVNASGVTVCYRAAAASFVRPPARTRVAGTTGARKHAQGSRVGGRKPRVTGTQAPWGPTPCGAKAAHPVDIALTLGTTTP